MTHSAAPVTFFRKLVSIFAKLVAGGALACATTGFAAARDGARQLLHLSLSAQGGEASLRSIRAVEVRSRGYRNMLEQSERPEGPPIPEFQSVRETRDHAGGRYRVQVDAGFGSQTYSLGSVADRTSAVRFANTRTGPGTAELRAGGREALALSPEHILLTALDSPDVRLAPPVTLQGVAQDVVEFAVDGSPVRLYLNRFTHLPTAFDYSGALARSNYWRFLGDISMRAYFSSWWLGDGGVRWPMQTDIYRNGLHDSTLTADAVSINPALNEAELKISPELRSAFVAGAAPEPPLGAAVDVAPGMTLIRGPWNVVIVRQNDGIVILEAPISSAYSELVIAEALRRYPDQPIKALVTTSDAWPHIAGLRAYVARGIPIYCLDLNVPILSRLVQARFKSRPDALERQPRSPLFRPITSTTQLGKGAQRIDLYPLRGESSERQVMAYVAGQRLLYGSDVFQQGPDGAFLNAEGVAEVIEAVDREGLKPAQLVMMHLGPIPWNAVKRITDPFPNLTEK